MGDGDNPLSGILGMIVMISVLPMILQMLSGLGGGGGQQGPIGGPLPQAGSFGTNPFMVTQPVVGPGNYLLNPGQTYSYGQWRTPVNLGSPVAPATIPEIYGGLTNQGRGWFGR